MKIFWRAKQPGKFDHEMAWGIVASLALLAARFFPFDRVPLGVPCWFHQLSGLPCPSCGGTRAFIGLAHGHLKEGFLLNPAAAILFVGLIGFVPYAAWVSLRRRQRLRIGGTSPRERALLAALVAVLILLNWTYLILAGR